MDVAILFEDFLFYCRLCIILRLDTLHKTGPNGTKVEITNLTKAESNLFAVGVSIPNKTLIRSAIFCTTQPLDIQTGRLTHYATESSVAIVRMMMLRMTTTTTRTIEL